MPLTRNRKWKAYHLVKLFLCLQPEHFSSSQYFQENLDIMLCNQIKDTTFKNSASLSSISICLRRKVNTFFVYVKLCKYFTCFLFSFWRTLKVSEEIAGTYFFFSYLLSSIPIYFYSQLPVEETWLAHQVLYFHQTSLILILIAETVTGLSLLIMIMLYH